MSFDRRRHLPAEDQIERAQRPPGRRRGQPGADDDAETREEGRSPRGRRSRLDDIWEGCR